MPPKEEEEEEEEEGEKELEGPVTEIKPKKEELVKERHEFDIFNDTLNIRLNEIINIFEVGVKIQDLKIQTFILTLILCLLKELTNNKIDENFYESNELNIRVKRFNVLLFYSLQDAIRRNDFSPFPIFNIYDFKERQEILNNYLFIFTCQCSIYQTGHITLSKIVVSSITYIQSEGDNAFKKIPKNTYILRSPKEYSYYSMNLLYLVYNMATLMSYRFLDVKIYSDFNDVLTFDLDNDKLNLNFYNSTYDIKELKEPIHNNYLISYCQLYYTFINSNYLSIDFFKQPIEDVINIFKNTKKTQNYIIYLKNFTFTQEFIKGAFTERMAKFSDVITDYIETRDDTDYYVFIYYMVGYDIINKIIANKEKLNKLKEITEENIKQKEIEIKQIEEVTLTQTQKIMSNVSTKKMKTEIISNPLKPTEGDIIFDRIENLGQRIENLGIKINDSTESKLDKIFKELYKDKKVSNSTFKYNNEYILKNKGLFKLLTYTSSGLVAIKDDTIIKALKNLYTYIKS